MKMKKSNNRNYLTLSTMSMLIICSLFLYSCGKIGKAIDPGDWGYNCMVTYDGLGGTINTRSTRTTYYIPNSYLFKPSGTTNMLINPIRDGYILAGWYSAKEDIADKDGNIIAYHFDPDDRWDFDEDRVQQSMTLYARWLPVGQANYIDPQTGVIKFSKNINESSGVSVLTSAAELLIKKEGYEFDGYFADKACTIPFKFSDVVIKPLIPDLKNVYEIIANEFPDCFNQIEYVEPQETDSIIDNSDLFIHKLGYELTETGKSSSVELRKRKNTIYEQAIDEYLENTKSQNIYLKYSKGGVLKISSPDDLRSADGKTWFSGFDKQGNVVNSYVLTADLDFKGYVLVSAGKYSGEIIGNGHSLKNITFNIRSKVVDRDTSKTITLFDELNGAYIENLTIENMSIKLSVNPGIAVTAAPLAANAINTSLKNVKITGLTIDTGKGDNGAAPYKIGDLFAEEKNTRLSGVIGSDISIKASDKAKVYYMLQK